MSSVVQTTPSKRPEQVVTVLAVGSDDVDRVALRRIIGLSNWVMFEANTCVEAELVLDREHPGVVLCEAQLADGNWLRILNESRRQNQPPPVIVSCGQPDEQLWAEVLNLGGYDVLAKPYDRQEVVRILSLAWLNWKHRVRSEKQAARQGTAAAC